MTLPDDLILNAADEVAIRQHLLLVSLGKKPADSVIEVGRLLAVHANHWMDDQEIVISGRRIAYVRNADGLTVEFLGRRSQSGMR